MKIIQADYQFIFSVYRSIIINIILMFHRFCIHNQSRPVLSPCYAWQMHKLIINSFSRWWRNYESLQSALIIQICRITVTKRLIKATNRGLIISCPSIPQRNLKPSPNPNPYPNPWTLTILLQWVGFCLSLLHIAVM